MLVVEREADARSLYDATKEGGYIAIPVFTDPWLHPAINTLAFLYVWTPEDDAFLIPGDHPDATGMKIMPLPSIAHETFTPDAKKLLHTLPVFSDVVDLKGVEFLTFGTVIEEQKFFTPTMRHIYNRFRGQRLKHLNRAVPIMQLLAYCEAYTEHLVQVRDAYVPEDRAIQFHNHTIIPATTMMERAGIAVNSNFTHPQLVTNGLTYSEYNPYTITHRVTNKFGGYNFSAIPKTGGEREAYVSRFPDGQLILIDFESFHLRLIGEMIGYDLPEGSVHEYFAKEYFNTDAPTDDEYQEGKQRTFRYTYSPNKEGEKYPFFARIYEFIDLIWEEIQEFGFIESDSGMRITLEHVEEPNPSKIFNYLLQMREMEVTMRAIAQLEPLFKAHRSLVTLYTYDSLLIDFMQSEGYGLLRETVSILEDGGRYPVRIYAGKNYADLVNITHLIKT
jgi:hypothetical protein